MGLTHVGMKLINLRHPAKSVVVPKAMVDTGSEFTWISTKTLESIGIDRVKKDQPFVMANGTVITRSIGYAEILVGQQRTVDEVVFAEKGDLLLLGARTLEGLGLMVDPRRKRLVASGPAPVASVVRR